MCEHILQLNTSEGGGGGGRLVDTGWVPLIGLEQSISAGNTLETDPPP